MKKLLLIAVLVTVCAGPATAQQQALSRQDSVIAEAKSFVGMFAKGDYAKCVLLFDSTMSAVMPAPKVGETWAAVSSQCGQFVAQLGARSQKYGTFDIVFVTCAFEGDTLDIRVVYNSARKIAGLFFAKSLPPQVYHAPPYAKPSAFREEQVIVGTGTWALHGTLTVPAGRTSVPAIVLVHGSGPNDRDETVGPNKPFCDLAWGLASNGVAVLRYEKRTREHGVELVAFKQTLTVKEEVIDDAVAAVALLRQTRGVDANRIYVLGHSLGGMLAPRIGKLDPHIAGLVILAGPARPLEDLILEQTKYILSLTSNVSEKGKDHVERVRGERERVKSLKMSDTASTELIMAAPATYWLDLQGYDPPGMARTLSMPKLILQGERDYQVTMEDFNRWKSALRSVANVTLKSYPTLNHLFIAGEGKSTPAEYEKSGNVLEAVIVDIANWVKK